MLGPAVALCLLFARHALPSTASPGVHVADSSTAQVGVDSGYATSDGERIYGLADGPENRADYESNEQVNALIAEENGQRFRVNGHIDRNLFLVQKRH